MELKLRPYDVEEAARLLSLPVDEVIRLMKEGELAKRTFITAESILDFAARKKIEIKQ